MPVDRLAFPHVGLGQVQLDLAAKSCVLYLSFLGAGSLGMWHKYRVAALPNGLEEEKKNHSTQDSHVVPHHGTNWAADWLTLQIGRDAVLSEPYGRG